MAVQLFVPTFRTEECLAQIRECLDKGWTGLGFKTNEFEESWKKYTGLPHAHFLNSNTSGLHLALHQLKAEGGWADGDEVISASLTFVSSNHAIMYANLTPVFADVDEYLCIDPKSIEKLIGPKTRAVMFVGLGGNTGRLPEVVELCRAKGLKLILDAAHMSGTKFNGHHVGGESDVAVFSFQAVKNLPTADSGMICWKNKEQDDKCRKLTWLGINKDTYARTSGGGNYKWLYDVEEVGFKYHGNSIMAAIGLVQLKYLDADNAVRAKIRQQYVKELEGVGDLKFVPTAPGCESSFHLAQIRTSRRDDLLTFLNQNEIFPGVHYRDNKEYALYSKFRGECPKALQASKEIISLPLHLRMTENDASEVVRQVRRFFG